MQEEDDLRGLTKIMVFMRVVSILLKELFLDAFVFLALGRKGVICIR